MLEESELAQGKSAANGQETTYFRTLKYRGVLARRLVLALAAVPHLVLHEVSLSDCRCLPVSWTPALLLSLMLCFGSSPLQSCQTRGEHAYVLTRPLNVGIAI